MSADNAVFIIDIPVGYAVLEATLSGMPSMIRHYMSKGSDHSGRKILCFIGKDADTQAESYARGMLTQTMTEYGIVDFRNPARDYKPEFHKNHKKG